MMLDRMEGNAELKTSVHQMLASRRLTHSVLLVGEEGLGAGFAARCIAADYLYPAGGAPAEALLRGECCRAVGKAGKRDSGQIETGIVREAISVEGMGAGGRYLVSQVTAMRSEIFNTSLSAEGRAVLLYHVERMNEESANALLKVMEEPPEGVLFLLTADSLAGVLPPLQEQGVYLAAQCCEHLNRALIVEHEAVPNGEIVNVLPQPKAGSSFATAAYKAFRHPVALEEIHADAGLDIGGTLIGMHLKKVAVPVRLKQNRIGQAIVLAARTRPKFIGGERAIYDESLKDGYPDFTD